ncbi:DUF1622 domain-containing protein [Archangium sp.]|uniref:DUF1622 domain-containing protein n=1 Tax=Archangium sp. TaxID=1872627 RepID=UPI002D75BA3A|nr:DUF1622 domain-containing protein [Archangium sp.]HYO58592.1 DUF1622 domain-containing protein [Archangium sp.]
MEAKELVSLAAHAFEFAGVGIMVAGALVSIVMVLLRRHKETGESAFRHFREKLGRSILLGLELLVAADIIRTVSEEPTLQGVLVLGLIVVIRTFLSFTLAVELEGYWPWERAKYKALEERKRTLSPERRPGEEPRAPLEQPPLEH